MPQGFDAKHGGELFPVNESSVSRREFHERGAPSTLVSAFNTCLKSILVRYCWKRICDGSRKVHRRYAGVERMVISDINRINKRGEALFVP
jgi:hypothetical protein